MPIRGVENFKKCDISPLYPFLLSPSPSLSFPYFLWGSTLEPATLLEGLEQSRLNVLGGPGPARLMGPLSSIWPTWRGGAVVLCTGESGNTHLGFNQGQT